LKRLLKPNGTLIIAVPNFKSFDAKYCFNAYDVPIHFGSTAINAFRKEDMKLVKVLL
jgi:hypothetical protein